MSSPRPDRGAYGFALRGVDGARRLLVEAPDDWPPLELDWQAQVKAPPEDEIVDAAHARVRLSAGGSLHVDRVRSRALYVMPERPPDEELVHPYLAPAASIAARWLGRESFHAGAVVLGDGAWALLGDKGAGKSSMLAWLDRSSHPVLADDLLVLDGEMALAGPRSIDLREGAAAQLGAGEPLGRVGLRDRWRLRLSPVAAAVQLRGWVALTWHDGVPQLVAIRGADRLRAIAPHRAVRVVPADPGMLIALGALPCYELRRPRRWAAQGDAAELLVASLAGR